MSFSVAILINSRMFYSYRLGVLGFFTSKELRDAGYKPNNGIRDQRIAIQWVHRHIKDFGGDPKNITVAGMSAGGGMGSFLSQGVHI